MERELNLSRDLRSLLEVEESLSGSRRIIAALDALVQSAAWLVTTQ